MAGALDLNMGTAVGGSLVASVITGGRTVASGTAQTHDFGNNTCTASGGTGPYTYLWSVASDTNGTWTTGGTSTTFDVSVSAVFKADKTIATYICTVTDSLSAKARSNSAQYQYINTATP